jgi:hypothetical protein
MKYLVFLLISLTACTYSLNIAQSEGEGKDLIKENARSEFDLKLDGNIPL